MNDDYVGVPPPAPQFPPQVPPHLSAPLGEPPIERAVQSLGKLIAELEQAVTHLEDRLDVALTPPAPALQTPGMPCPPAPTRSELARNIAGKAEDVTALIARIKSVTNRVEL